MPRLHSVAAIDRLETAKPQSVPEVVWQQPEQTHLIDMYENSTPNNKRKNDEVSQMLPIKEISHQVFGSDLESLLENQNRSTSVQCLNDSKKPQHEIQRNGTDMTTHDSGDDNIFHPKIPTSQI